MTDPNDDTQAHPSLPPLPRPATGSTREPRRDGNDPAGVDRDPRIDPDRPASTWREPAWFPPRRKDRGPNAAAVVGGLILIAIGLYFFLDRTLGIEMPRIQWGTIWPVILIAIGALVLIRSVKRGS
ncbi:MAG: hypothetical protein QOF49_1109 [Chloroflexota bacterium]|jgi:hypothetical protein|nr:hypothetical protein [Chloroflexota bacterium]